MCQHTNHFLQRYIHAVAFATQRFLLGKRVCRIIDLLNRHVIEHISSKAVIFAATLKQRRDMLKQAFYILFFYFTGEFISYFIDGFIPGSVIGMILLFLALVFKLVKPDNVKKLSTLLTENMGLFFLPAGVGLMTALGVISQYWAVILTASVVSTILVIATVAFIQQKLGKEGAENE